MAHPINPLPRASAFDGKAVIQGVAVQQTPSARPDTERGPRHRQADVQRNAATGSLKHPASVKVVEEEAGHGGGQLLSAIQVAQKHKLSYQTVNYYTNLGLLVAVKRQGHHRLYDAVQTEQRLLEVESLKLQGYPLKLISQRLSSVRIS